MRQLEEKFLEAKRAELAEKASAQEMAIFEETIAPAMAEVQSMLSDDDKVSNSSLEAIAKWKLEM